MRGETCLAFAQCHCLIDVFRFLNLDLEFGISFNVLVSPPLRQLILEFGTGPRKLYSTETTLQKVHSCLFQESIPFQISIKTVFRRVEIRCIQNYF